MFRRIHPLRQSGQDVLDISGHTGRNADVFPDLGGVDVKMQDFRPFSEFFFIAGRTIAESRSDGDDQIRFGDGLSRGIVAVHTDHAQEIRVAA